MTAAVWHGHIVTGRYRSPGVQRRMGAFTAQDHHATLRAHVRFAKLVR
ncbi:MAG: hypothetical protein ACK4ZW_00425 [Blastomonas sp.]